MKHPTRMISILVLAAALVGATGCTATKEQTQAEPAAFGFTASAGQPALFSSTIDTTPYLISVSSLSNPQTYYDAQDLVDETGFTEVAINLEEPVSENSEVFITRSEEGYLTITNEGTNLYNYVLSGTLIGTVTITSDAATYAITFKNASITGTTLPALQLKSSTKAFINLAQGTQNIISDSSDNEKKGVLTAEGDVIIHGEGSLEVVANKKHALKIDGTLRIQSGTISITTNEASEGNGISVDEAFIMDDGSLTIEANGSVYQEEGKGIRVNGIESESGEKGYLVVNGGTIGITSVGKAMTAGWDKDEDAETEDTRDDPTPNLIINNGVITLRTTGKPYEISDEASLSPEGLEAKQSLIINGGLIQVSTTDDALNAGTSIQIHGGLIMAHSSQADAVDSNGTIAITAGTLVALGSRAPETALDCDANQNFSYTGGTVVAIGGAANNTPLAQDTTGNVLTYGGKLAAGTSFVLADAQENTIIAYAVPAYYEQGAALLLCSDELTQGKEVTLSVGGELKASTTFNGLALGKATYTGGTSEAITLSASVTHLGEELRSMGFGPNPPHGFEPPVFQQ